MSKNIKADVGNNWFFSNKIIAVKLSNNKSEKKIQIC